MAIPFHDKRTGEVTELSDSTLTRRINSHIQMWSNSTGKRMPLANPNVELSPARRSQFEALATDPKEHYDCCFRNPFE